MFERGRMKSAVIMFENEQKNLVSDAAKQRWEDRKGSLAITPSDGNGFFEAAEQELVDRAHAAVEDRNQEALSNTMARIATLADYKSLICKLMGEQLNEQVSDAMLRDVEPERLTKRRRQRRRK